MSMRATGTRQEVWDGKADHTSSGLKKDKFILNKRGKVVSKARSLASQQNVERLRKFQFSKKEEPTKIKKNGERSAPRKSKK